jgi:hypothetical protein
VDVHVAHDYGILDRNHKNKKVGNLLFPAATFDSSEFFFRHSVTGSEITWDDKFSLCISLSGKPGVLAR